METTLKRHGFITFWLWLGIIADIISGPVMIISYQGLKDSLRQYDNVLIDAEVDAEPLLGDEVQAYIIILQVAALLSSILLIFGYYKLLEWRKFGFFLNATVAVVNVIIYSVMLYLINQEVLYLGFNLFGPQIALTAIGAVLGILILWAILQIRKDGISCWKQLK